MRRLRAAGVAAAAGVALLGCAPEPERPPTVVIVSIDTLNRDALRAYHPGAGPLPELDAFADQSIRFVNALSPSAWTLPAHASLLTGLYPDRHGATRRNVAIARGLVTLGAALRKQRYETAAFTDGGYLDSRYGFPRGFDRYDGWAAGTTVSSEALPDRGRPPKRPGTDLFARAIAFLSERPPDPPPLFLFLQTYVVHNYFRLNAWSLERLGRSLPRASDDYQKCLVGRKRCAESDWADLETLYRYEVERTSEGFGRLVAALEEAGLWDESVVFFTSDHGEGFDPARGRTHHGGRLHADVLRVPLLVRVPGEAPREEPTPVSLVDLMPTVIELVGGAAIAGLDGRSFAALLRGDGDVEPRALYAMEHFTRWEDGRRHKVTTPPEAPLSLAVIDGRRWYIRDSAGREELYDVLTDPEQRRDLAADAEGLPTLRRLADERGGYRVDAPAFEEDEGLRQALEALGYIE